MKAIKSLQREILLTLNQFHFRIQPNTAKIYLYIEPIANGLVFTKEYIEFENFFKNKTQMFNKIARKIEQSLEIVRNNNRWYKQNHVKFERLLSEF